jgi:DNA polymerase-3 subunit alpha
MLWSDDYVNNSKFMEKGNNLFMTGYFRQRYNKSEFEFKVDKIILLENIKQNLTKQVIIDVEARHVNDDMIRFIEKNVKMYPGRSGLRFNITELKTRYKISMHNRENGFEMNDEMAAFLQNRPEVEVQVVTV